MKGVKMSSSIREKPVAKVAEAMLDSKREDLKRSNRSVKRAEELLAELQENRNTIETDINTLKTLLEGELRIAEKEEVAEGG